MFGISIYNSYCALGAWQGIIISLSMVAHLMLESRLAFEISNGAYIKLPTETTLFVHKSWRILLKHCIFAFGWIIDWSFTLYYGHWKFNLVMDKDAHACT